MNKDEALSLYRDKMEFRNLSPKTIKMYEFYLRKYFESTGEDDISQLTIEDSINYVADLKKSGKFTPQSLNIIISEKVTKCHVRAFGHFPAACGVEPSVI